MFENNLIEFKGERVDYSDFLKMIDDSSLQEITNEITVDGKLINFLSTDEMLEGPYLRNFINSSNENLLTSSENDYLSYDDNNLSYVHDPNALGVITTVVISSVIGSVAGTIVSKVIDKAGKDDGFDPTLENWVKSGLLDFDNNVIHLSKKFTSKLIEDNIISKTKFPNVLKYENLTESINLNPNINEKIRNKLLDGIKNGELRIEHSLNYN